MFNPYHCLYTPAHSCTQILEHKLEKIKTKVSKFFRVQFRYTSILSHLRTLHFSRTRFVNAKTFKKNGLEAKNVDRLRFQNIIITELQSHQYFWLTILFLLYSFAPKLSGNHYVTHTEHSIGGIIVLVVCFLLGSFPVSEFYIPALIINQQMHYIKFHIKTFKNAPTCFDPKIILREVSCSLLKSL